MVNASREHKEFCLLNVFYHGSYEKRVQKKCILEVDTILISSSKLGHSLIGFPYYIENYSSIVKELDNNSSLSTKDRNIQLLIVANKLRKLYRTAIDVQIKIYTDYIDRITKDKEYNYYDSILSAKKRIKDYIKEKKYVHTYFDIYYYKKGDTIDKAYSIETDNIPIRDSMSITDMTYEPYKIPFDELNPSFFSNSKYHNRPKVDFMLCNFIKDYYQEKIEQGNISYFIIIDTSCSPIYMDNSNEYIKNIKNRHLPVKKRSHNSYIQKKSRRSRKYKSL